MTIEPILMFSTSVAGFAAEFLFANENALIVTGQSRSVNHGTFYSFNGLGRIQPRELHRSKDMHSNASRFPIAE